MNSTTKDSQQRAARLAGLMYLLTIVTWAFAFYVRSSLIVDGNASETVNNIVTNERLFRISIVSDLVTFAGGMPTRAFPVCERLGSTTGGGYEVSLGRFRGKAGRCRCPTGFEL